MLEGHTKRFKIALLLAATASSSTAFLNNNGHPTNHGFKIIQPTTSIQRSTPLIKDSPTFSVLASSTQEDQEQKVISNFESWFKAQPSSDLNASIQHAYFGKLRGLSWTAPASSVPSTNTPVISVSNALVLQSDIHPEIPTETDDWDAKLATLLWTECRRGDQSKIAGYCNFLMHTDASNNNAAVEGNLSPPSTAPNALRHWTPEERTTLLDGIPAGKKLLALQEDQQLTWTNKYETMTRASEKSTMSLEQFQWAMEVVHSRAFRGNFGSNAAKSASDSLVSSLLPTILPPLGAALAGWAYIQSTPYPSDLVLGGLAIAAILPLGFNLLASSSTPPSAVLLPMIDSANHKEDADSSIEYDPLTQSFQMSIGQLCLTELQQLCISYGKRSDVELLLNYGFLPGESCSDDSSLFAQRERLAKAFLEGR